MVEINVETPTGPLQIMIDAPNLVANECKQIYQGLLDGKNVTVKAIPQPRYAEIMAINVAMRFQEKRPEPVLIPIICVVLARTFGWTTADLSRFFISDDLPADLMLVVMETATGPLIAHMELTSTDCATELAHNVVKALQHLARCGIVHTDISPANIAMHHGRVCLLDLESLRYRETYDRRESYGTPGFIDPFLHYCVTHRDYFPSSLVSAIVAIFTVHLGENPMLAFLNTFEFTYTDLKERYDFYHSLLRYIEDHCDDGLCELLTSLKITPSSAETSETHALTRS